MSVKWAVIQTLYKSTSGLATEEIDSITEMIDNMYKSLKCKCNFTYHIIVNSCLAFEVMY